MDGLNLKIGDSTMEIIKLRELADIQTGPFGSQLHKEDYVQVGTPIVTVEHLGKRVFTEQNLPHVDNKDKIRLKKYSLLEGDIVFSRVGAIDRSSYVDKEHEGWLFSGRCLRIRPYRKVYPLYLYYYLQLERVKSFIRSIAVGATMPSINTSILGKVNILVPEIAVQKNIAKQMAILDDKIELSNDLNRKLQQFRQAMLTKLFPREGAEEPELHFEGNLNCWKAFRLGDCVDRLDNLRVPVSATNRIAGTTPYYGANGIQDYVSGYTHEGEFILIAEDGANDLDNYPIQYVNGRIWVNNHAHVLQGKPKIVDTKFLKYALSQVDMRFYLVGGSRSKLNSNIMMNIELNLPIDIDEQRKIGDLLGELDKFISLQQKKLERMQRLKAALLEKMFV